MKPWDTIGPETNITHGMQELFNALTSGEYKNFALFSCFVNGEPTAAIVTLNEDDKGQIVIDPYFVAITPSMKLVDHDGKAPGEEVTKEA